MLVILIRSIHYVSHADDSQTTLLRLYSDDNPVERLFSDIQVMILNNSNDPDPQTAQRRISAYFQRRNRRKNWRIRIAFLPDSHKIA